MYTRGIPGEVMLNQIKALSQAVVINAEAMLTVVI